MSALTVWEGLEERFLTIVGIKAVILGEPNTVQEAPLLYAGYGSAEEIMRSAAPANNLDGITHIFGVRLAFDWQENAQAELQLLTLADAVPRAINEDPRLGGRLYGGVAKSTRAVAGWAPIGKKVYRVLDHTVTVIEKGPST